MVYIFLADGFEEIEAITVIDILRRCNIKTTIVGIGKNKILGSHGIEILVDIIDKDILISTEIDMVILPGGVPGVFNLEKSEYLKSCLNFCIKNDIYVAAICAAPSILGKLNLLSNKKVVCYPGFEKYLIENLVDGKDVLEYKKIITAKSAASSFEFSFNIVEKLVGKIVLNKLKADLLWRD